MPSATTSSQTITGSIELPKKRQRKSKTTIALPSSALPTSNKHVSSPTLATPVQAAPMTVAAYVAQPAAAEHSKHMSNLLSPFARPSFENSSPVIETPPTQGLKTGGETAAGDAQVESISSGLPSSFTSSVGSVPSHLARQSLSPPQLSPMSSQGNSQPPQPPSPKPSSPAPVRHDHTLLLPPPKLAPPSLEAAITDDIGALGYRVSFLKKDGRASANVSIPLALLHRLRQKIRLMSRKKCVQLTRKDIDEATKELWEQQADFSKEFVNKWNQARYACDSSERSRAEVHCWDEFNRGRLPFSASLKPELAEDVCLAIAQRVMLQPGEFQPTKAELASVRAAYVDWCNPRCKRHIEDTLHDFYAPRVKGKKPADLKKRKGRKRRYTADDDEPDDEDDDPVQNAATPDYAPALQVPAAAAVAE